MPWLWSIRHRWLDLLSRVWWAHNNNIIIIIPTFQKELNISNVSEVYSVKCVSKIKPILSIIFYAIHGACVFSLLISLLMTVRKFVLYLIITISYMTSECHLKHKQYLMSWISIFTCQHHNPNVLCNQLWCHQQNINRASERRSRCMKKHTQ